LRWFPVAGAAGYNIYRGTAPGAENVLAGVVPGGVTSFLDVGGLTAAKPPSQDTSGGLTVVATPTVTPNLNADSTLAAGTYYYKITATDYGNPPNSAHGENTPSNEGSHVVAAGQALTVNWGAVAGATGYNIYRGTSAGNENVLIASISGGFNTSFVDDGNETVLSRNTPAANGTLVLPPVVQTPTTGGGQVPPGQYYYVVTAVNALGESTPSNEVGFLVNNLGGTDLTWAPSLNATSYNIYRGTQPGQEDLLVGSTFGAATSFNDSFNTAQTVFTEPFINTTGLGAPVANAVTPEPGGVLGTTYYYTVTATNTNGETIQSNELPVNITGSNHTVHLTWTTVANANGYKIYRGTAPGAESELVATLTSGTVTSFDDHGGPTNA
ncbi:MAG: hypothetical protein ACREHD_13230, partial [Pirellulales bacterium]